jgi:hypothetical protein
VREGLVQRGIVKAHARDVHIQADAVPAGLCVAGSVCVCVCEGMCVGQMHCGVARRAPAEQGDTLGVQMSRAMPSACACGCGLLTAAAARPA